MSSVDSLDRSLGLPITGDWRQELRWAQDVAAHGTCMNFRKLRHTGSDCALPDFVEKRFHESFSAFFESHLATVNYLAATRAKDELERLGGLQQMDLNPLIEERKRMLFEVIDTRGKTCAPAVPGERLSGGGVEIEVTNRMGSDIGAKVISTKDKIMVGDEVVVKATPESLAAMKKGLEVSWEGLRLRIANIGTHECIATILAIDKPDWQLGDIVKFERVPLLDDWRLIDEGIGLSRAIRVDENNQPRLDICQSRDTIIRAHNGDPRYAIYLGRLNLLADLFKRKAA